MTPSRFRQVIELMERLVGHRVGLQITPDVLHGVQLRGIGRQERRPPALFIGDMILNEACPMSHEPVPKQEDGTLKMPAEILKEREDRSGVDVGVGMKPEEQLHSVSAGRDDQCGDGGNFPIEVGPMPEQGRLAAGRPGPPHKRHHQEAAFVEKDESGAYPCSVFFTRGHSALTQSWMAVSSRSMARRWGFWGLQPRECKMRPIWST